MKVQLGLVVGSVFATVFLVFGLWQATIAAGRGTAGRATLAFHARVREAVGVPLQPGDGCQADVDVEARDGTADRVGLVLRCGGRLLYDSGASQGALSFVDFAAEESDGPEPESSVVALRYEDTGAPERRAQIHFDSHARSATLWRDGSTAFRVTLDVAPWSDAHTGGRLLAHDAAQP